MDPIILGAVGCVVPKIRSTAVLANDLTSGRNNLRRIRISASESDVAASDNVTRGLILREGWSGFF
jgi:hypothetical protein